MTPARSAILDLGVRVMTGSSPRHDFQNRLESILACLYSDFSVDRRADYFTFRHGMRIYAALRLMGAEGPSRRNLRATLSLRVEMLT